MGEDAVHLLIIANVEDIEATNEMIKESDGAQKLTNQEIEELKKSGLSGRVSRICFAQYLPSCSSRWLIRIVRKNIHPHHQEIILRQIQQHSAFELKSEFSKAKYIKRKEKK
jgi:tRNA (adenine-N(1)-)-methyltransferase non-catalytic subunit